MDDGAELRARYPDLNSKVALVTGGATGIGEAIVRALADQGVSVGILDIAQEAGEALASELSNGGAKVCFCRVDVTDTSSLRDAIGRIREKFGPIGILVNNAADDDRHRIEDVTPDYWDRQVAINLKHYFFAAQSVVPDMKAQGLGSIVNLSSISWVRGVGGMPVYLAAKAGIVGLTRALAKDLGGHGIRVNAVLPGWIMTERQRRLWVTPDDEAEILKSQSVKRFLLPSDISSMVLFLVSDASSACTAQSYIVDGGWT
jgi:NAD(P)-dependent dehydrogenase (short-subunit alcohol dehydrogenase family)